MSLLSPEHQTLVSRIRSSAEALVRAVETVPAGWHDRAPRTGEWSARETLIHLRNVVLLVQGLRLRRLLYEHDPVFADYDEAAHRQAGLRHGEPVRALVEMIVAEHGQIARLLETLPDVDWARQGRHPELGPMSIEWFARRVGEHTDEHAAQIADTARLLAEARQA